MSSVALVNTCDETSAACREAATKLKEVQEYWEGYAQRVLDRGGDSVPKEYFETLRKDHERAYSLANELLLRWGISGKSVLELGCGMGFDTVSFAQSGADVVAVDLSEKCLSLAQRHLDWYGVRAELRRDNAEALSMPAESFDVVTARGILMFTPDPSAVLREILRVLRPGGRVQAILHNKYSWHVMLAATTGMNLIDPFEDPEPNRLCTRRGARALFRGFNDVTIHTDRFPTMATRRPGLIARLFNTAVLPVLKRVPRRILGPFGLYFIVEATKPTDEGNGVAEACQ